MARPQKEGVDYFSLDVKMDDEVKLLEAKCGIAGFGVLIKLYQIIYDNGYYIKWTEREQLLYSNRINADINLITDVVAECMKWNLFSKEMYSKYEILTSRGIQKRYIEATQRRKEVSFYQEFLLLDLQEKYSERVIVNINKVIADINPINTDISTQSKVKESKVKERKVNKSINYTHDFEKFYSLYPNPFNKEQSFTNWKNTLKTDTVENVMTALANYKLYLEKTGITDKQFIVRSTNFIGQHKEYKGYLKEEKQEETPQKVKPVRVVGRVGS